MSHVTNDLLHLTRSVTLSIQRLHPHDSLTIFTASFLLFFSSLLSFPFPFFIQSFSFSILFIYLCHYPNLFPPPGRVVFTSRSFSFLISPSFLVVTGRPPLSGKFSQPPHPLIFHQPFPNTPHPHKHRLPSPHSSPPSPLSLSVRGTNAFVQYLQQTD